MYSRKSINKYRHTLSDKESKILSSLSYHGKTIFTLKDLRELVPEPKNVLDSMSRKKWILKLRKGVYLIAPLEAGERGAADYTVHSFVIASFLTDPYYVGYWSALNYHGLTEQTPASVYVATTKPRNSRTILDTRFIFVTIPRSKVFGICKTEIEKWQVRISTPEKTIVDCLDHPEHCGGIEEVAKAMFFSRDELDFGKIVKFAEGIGNNTVIKRLGYIAEALDIGECSKLLSNAKLKSGYSTLDPTLPRTGRIKERWRLIVNAPVNVSRWIM